MPDKKLLLKEATVNGLHVNSPYGYRNLGGGTKFHHGVDLHAKQGTPIRMNMAGKVKTAQFSTGACGGTISIHMEDGTNSRFCHMTEMYVKPGQDIPAGTVIGLTGGAQGSHGAGNSQGAHIHYEFKDTSGTLQDPAQNNPGKYWSVDGQAPTKNQPTNTTKVAYTSSKITNWDEAKAWIKSNLSTKDYTSYLLISTSGDVIRIYENGTTSNEQSLSKETWELYRLSNGKHSFKIGSKEYSPDLLAVAPNQSSASIGSTIGDIVSDASEVDEDWKAIDYIQTIMDFLGFIPGFGDVIDLINAMIYFYRGKHIDGVLSLVAIIPVAGSVIALSLKGSFKAMKASKFGFNTTKMIKNALQGNPELWQKFLKEQVKEGKLTTAQLKQMEAWGDEAAKMLRASGRKLRKWESELSWVGLDAKTVSNTFDAWAKHVDDLFVHTGTSAFNVSKATKIRKTIQKGVAKVTWKVVKLPFKLVFMAGNVLTGGFLRIGVDSLKNLFGWTTGKQAKLMRAMNQAYAKKLISSPMLSAQMMKANRQTASNLEKILPNYFPGKQLSRIWDENTHDLYQMLKKLKDTDPKQYNRVAKQIAAQSESANNIWYRAFVADELSAAYNVTKPGAVFKQNIADNGVLGVFNEFKFGLKTWDVLSNEVQDLAEQLGYDNHDDPNGLVVPLLFSTYMHTLGAATKETPEAINPTDVINNSEVSAIKQMYDSAPGQSVAEKKDYLISEEGVSMIKMWAFMEIMDLVAGE